MHPLSRWACDQIALGMTYVDVVTRLARHERGRNTVGDTPTVHHEWAARDGLMHAWFQNSLLVQKTRSGCGNDGWLSSGAKTSASAGRNVASLRRRGGD